MEAIRIIKLAIVIFILCFLTGCDESYFIPNTFEVSVWKSKSLMKTDYEYFEDTGEYGGSLSFMWELK